MFLPQCDRPSFTPIQNNRQNYSSVDTKLILLNSGACHFFTNCIIIIIIIIIITIIIITHSVAYRLITTLNYNILKLTH
jgi:hypothetical protein